MATTHGVSLLTCRKQLSFNDQFNSINLNQNHKYNLNEQLVPSYSNSTSKKKFFATLKKSDTTIPKPENGKSSLWNKSSRNLNRLIAVDNDDNDTIKNKSYDKNSDSKSSTLSLNIRAYENYIEGNSAIGEDKKVVEKGNGSKQIKASVDSYALFQDSWEFPRQPQDDRQTSTPAIMNFSASQHLYSPQQNPPLSGATFTPINGTPSASVQQQPPQSFAGSGNMGSSTSSFPNHQFHLPPPQAYQNPTPDQLAEIYNRLYNLELRLNNQETMLNALTEANERLHTQNNQLVGLLTNNATVNANFVFDPANYTNRTIYNMNLKFHDSFDRDANLFDIASSLAIWRRTANDSFPGDLFRGLIKNIYGDSLINYTAATSRRGNLTSICELKEGIKNLVLKGYTSATTTEAETLILKCWIDESIDKVSRNLFNNSRRPARGGADTTPSRSADTTPSRNVSKNKSVRKRRAIVSDDDEEEEED